MPAYDFKCTACDDIFEVVRPGGSTEPVSCGECGGSAKRVFTPVGVVFKGSGFHNTDYRPRPNDDAPTAQPCGSSGASSSCASCPAASSD